MLAVCVVLWTLSDNTCTYVQVHVCDSAWSGGGAIWRLMTIETRKETFNIFAPPLEVLGHDVATLVGPKSALHICHVLCTCTMSLPLLSFTPDHHVFYMCM